jgi:site-specific recombinase XerD
MDEKLKAEILEQLQKRNYQEITVKLYAHQLFNLFAFYPQTKPKEISKEQVAQYAKSLIARKYSRSTVSQFIYACNFFFSEQNSLHKGYYNVKLPLASNTSPEFFLQSEILELIESKTNLKHKAIILLMYSCGLGTGELINLRVQDIRSREKRPNIIVSNTTDGSVRKSFLSKQVLPFLNAYYKESQPTEWLFYGAEGKSEKYTTTSLGKMIKDAIAALDFSPQLNAKSLRYSYIKHLTELGVPLPVILNHLGIQGVETQLRYAKLVHETQDISFTPLDKMINENQQIDEFKDLEHLIFELSDEAEIKYLMEGVTCFRAGALRAGVIFIWSAVVNNIRKQLIDIYELKNINIELRAIDPKAKQIKSHETFEFFKDQTVIQLSERLGHFDKMEKNELIDSCLGLRNKCGHPSNYTPEIQRVKGFVEDVLNIIYKKKSI